MSEFWVSRKKWTCKYCDVTINDDVPSRQQHENGLRHKGNVERSLRNAYKKSERERKDEKDVKRVMEKIERVSVLLAFFPELRVGSRHTDKTPLPFSFCICSSHSKVMQKILRNPALLHRIL